MPAKMNALLGGEWHLIAEPQQLDADRLRELAPRYVFFPHWSHIIPASVYESFECVVFHMTDLPEGRGGSPLQNLIVRGKTETMLSALRVEAGLDTGPLYGKRPLSLLGTAEEILLRASHATEELIHHIVSQEPTPQPQRGEGSTFRRRRPEQGNVAELETLAQVHDTIRMLDADGYPRAFFETSNLRFEFSRASLKYDRVVADVTIFPKRTGASED